LHENLGPGERLIYAGRLAPVPAPGASVMGDLAAALAELPAALALPPRPLNAALAALPALELAAMSGTRRDLAAALAPLREALVAAAPVVASDSPQNQSGGVQHSGKR
jgi:hypothetical protein